MPRMGAFHTRGGDYGTAPDNGDDNDSCNLGPGQGFVHQLDPVLFL